MKNTPSGVTMNIRKEQTPIISVYSKSKVLGQSTFASTMKYYILHAIQIT